MPDELTPQGRAARATWLLLTQGPMSEWELAAALEYRNRFSVRDLIRNLAVGVPLSFDEAAGVWRLDHDPAQE